MSILVMGVMGSGKSTIASRLAEAMGWRFVDADDLHPTTNIEKMTAGRPLDDFDRDPWLGSVGEELARGRTVVACSALRRRYRDRLRQADPAMVLVHLHGDPILLERRLASRSHPFMPAHLLETQLATLEPPTLDEGAIEIDIALPPDRVVAAAAAQLHDRLGTVPFPPPSPAPIEGDLTTDPVSILSEHTFGDATARYTTDEDGRVGLWLYPTVTAVPLANRRATVANESWVRARDRDRRAIGVNPLVHIKIVGDDQPGQFGPGRTLMWAPSNDRFRLLDQVVDGSVVITRLGGPSGLVIEHRLSPDYRGLTLRSDTALLNCSATPVRLELLTSFSLSGITPYAPDDGPDRLVAHRFRSVWSAEGRLVSDPIEHLHLERSWAGDMKFSERFGQVGSMPVRGWFPTALVEDTDAGVVWGARLASPTSWQMELGRLDDDLVLSGGQADREFGHWTKTVAPGERFAAPAAWITTVQGTLDDACDRLMSIDIPAADGQPAIEQDLPIIYNDWCTSWGDPREERLLATADRVAALGVRYFVIDAGWYMPIGADAHWSTALGDWEADLRRFPGGLASTAAALRERGLVPGLWMEPEHVAKDSVAFSQTDHLLQKDGRPLTMGVRRGWDLHDPYATAYIDERVIRMIEAAGFGYLKIDYSETIGIGVDHPDGLGEGLRRHGEGTHAMFDRITAALPDLVVEICSAGGHRMEASLLQRSAMSSFSDAHELVEIPVVAAAVQRVVLPRQSQIWAVLNEHDSPDRLGFSLAATFLGRMCLSGDILALTEEQLAIVRAGIALYERAAPIIRDGSTRLSGTVGPSWRHPTGWQAAVRISGNRGLVVIHTFVGAPTAFDVSLPGDGWSIVETLTSLPVEVRGSNLCVERGADLIAQVVLIER